LVIISEEDGLLLHQQYAEIPFHSFKRMPCPVSGDWYTCPRCEASVRHGTGHEQNCRQRHEKAPPSPPPIQSSNLNNPPRSNPPDRNSRQGRSVYSARPSHWPTKPQLPRSTEESAKFKASLKRLNWSEPELVEIEEKFVSEAWNDVPAGELSKVEKMAKALVLERIQKLPRPLRNLLLHRFEEKKWAQLSYFR